MAILELKDIKYYYYKSNPVLKGISKEFEAGKVYAIVGHSGCGKTTLLSVIGGLDVPRSGKIFVDGKDISEISLEQHRAKNIAFVFQNYNLIEYMTPAENVSLTTKESPLPYLEAVGLTPEQAKRNVLKLSGGEQQRVAVARALASPARIILADEPTGNLDEKTADDIAKLLIKSARDYNKCVIVVSHSRDVANQADEVLQLKDGLLTVEADADDVTE